MRANLVLAVKGEPFSVISNSEVLGLRPDLLHDAVVKPSYGRVQPT